MPAKTTAPPAKTIVSFEVPPLAVQLFESMGAKAVERGKERPATMNEVARKVFLDFVRGNGRLD